MTKTTVASCSALVLALAVSGVVAAETGTSAAPLGQAEQARRQAIEKVYAAQDVELQKADQLVNKGSIVDAINIYRTVAYELELNLEQLDSWRAKARFNEISRKLRELEFAYASDRLVRAEEAFVQGRFNEVITLADEAKRYCAALAQEAEKWKQSAVFKQRGEERKQEMNAENLFPMQRDNEKMIRRELAVARTLFRNGQYEAARRRVEAVYKINPYDQEAAHLANQLYEKYYTAGYRRHQADVQSMLAFAAWQWVEPVFYRNVDKQEVADGIVVGSGDQAIQAKLDNIVFPQVRFDQTDIVAVIDFLRRNYNYDLPSKTGVKIDFSIGNSRAQGKTDAEGTDQDGRQGGAAAAQPQPPQQQANAENGEEGGEEGSGEAGGSQEKNELSNLQVTLSVNNVTLRELLDYICFLTDLRYVVMSDRVVFGSAGEQIKSGTFQLTPEGLRLIAGVNAPVDSEAALTAPEEEGEDGGEGGGAAAAAATGSKDEVPTVSQDQLKAFFKTYGVDFDDPGSSITYDPRGEIIMANTTANLQRLGDVLRFINTPKPQVQIEVKTIEISEQRWQELGFNWVLGSFSNKNWSFGKGQATAYDGVSAPVLSMLRSSLNGIDTSFIKDLNIFPDIFGSIRPFGGDEEFNLSLTINALDRSDHTETISAPTVTVAHNKTAYATLCKKYYFPESWEELEIDIDSNDNSWSTGITPPTPEFGEATDIGTIFTVKPYVKNQSIINLSINPKITNFVGEDSYYMTVVITRFDPEGKETDKKTLTYRVWKPIISTREVDVNVDVQDGQTIVLGGLADSVSQRRLDKIPILGDIPFIGRLFQSQSENVVRRNVLIFVTARLVNDQGLPISRLSKTGGIPDVNR